MSFERQPLLADSDMACESKYASWSHAALVARILELEHAGSEEAVSRELPLVEENTPSTVPQKRISESEALASGCDNTLAKTKGVKRKKPKRAFDFSKYARRKIALRVFYYGWPYSGFAASFLREGQPPAIPAVSADGQADPVSRVSEDENAAEPPAPARLSLDTTTDTVERRLLEALMETKLIENPGTCDYQRCGRTDKTVSGFGQVVSLYVRSKLPKDHPEVAIYNQEQLSGGRPSDSTTAANEGMKNVSIVDRLNTEAVEVGRPFTVDIPSAADDQVQEISYVSYLNRVLPDTIRVVGWAPVPPTFSARFDCRRRTYKYHFAREDLDVDLMRDAAARMEGNHDFRNLCVLDGTGNVTRFVRTVFATSITLRSGGRKPERDMFEFRLDGTGFLYHQVRCIMAILFMVGQKLEKPDVVNALLDVERTPCRPIYEYADGLPLALYEAKYNGGTGDGDGLDWRYAIPGLMNGEEWPTAGAREQENDGELLRSVKQRLFVKWQEHAVKAALFEEGLEIVEDTMDRLAAEQGGEVKTEFRREPGPILGGGRYAHADRRKHQSLLGRRTLENYDSRARTLREKHEAKKRMKAAPNVAAACSTVAEASADTAAER